MKSKRIIAMIIVVAMSIAVLASCGDEKNVKNKGDGSNIDTQFPAADYEGEAFTFARYYSPVADGTVYYADRTWIDSDDITGQVVSDAVYNRNKICETKYNVEITVKEHDKGEDFDDYNHDYLIGELEFDVVYGWANRFSLGVTTGLFHDFTDLNNKGYIDMDQSYWNPDVNDSLSVADRYFLATNDILMEAIGWTGCMFFNPQIVENYGLENPHELVYNNEWTIDKFLEMVASVHGDLDGQADFTIEDCYGLIDIGTTNALLYGCDMHLVDDDYNLAIGTTRMTDLITKIHSVIEDKSHVFTMDDITNGVDTQNPWKYARSYFTNGHALFLTGTPALTGEFRDMDGGYGIVPLPKFDSNQTDYTASIDSCSGVFLLPNFEKRSDGVNSSYERTGYILEYLAYKSSEDTGESVLDAYYNTTIKGQRQAEIPENREMLDMIKGKGLYEWASVFWVGGDPSNDEKTIGGVLGEMASSGRGLASTYKKSQKRLQQAIDDIYDSIADLPMND